MLEWLVDWISWQTDLSRAEGQYMYKLPYPFAYRFALSWGALPDSDANHACPQTSRHQTVMRLTHANGAETDDTGTHVAEVIQYQYARIVICRASPTPRFSSRKNFLTAIVKLATHLHCEFIVPVNLRTWPVSLIQIGGSVCWADDRAPIEAPGIKLLYILSMFHFFFLYRKYMHTVLPSSWNIAIHVKKTTVLFRITLSGTILWSITLLTAG